MTRDLQHRSDELEQAVCEQVPFVIAHLPNSDTAPYDARLEQALPPSPAVASSACAGSVVEIKTCQWTTASGAHGQWVVHEAPHALLARAGGRYLLAVLEGFDLRHWVVCGPRDLTAHLDWDAVPETPGYDRAATISWPVVVGKRGGCDG